jgi:hypothetical protein
METTVHEDWICEYVTLTLSSVIVRTLQKGQLASGAKRIRLSIAALSLLLNKRQLL